MEFLLSYCGANWLICKEKHIWIEEMYFKI